MENIFEKYIRLSQAHSYIDAIESYKVVLDSALWLSKTVHDVKPAQSRTQRINDAMILFQMTMTKGLAIINLAESLNYYNEIGDFSFSNFIDPMSIATLTRTQYEAFANFHNVFNSTDNESAKDFLYYAWVLAGLKERRRFYKEPTTEEFLKLTPQSQKLALEHKKKFDKEQIEIDSIIEHIHRNPLYKEMNEQDRKSLDKKLNGRTFQFLFKDGKIKATYWLEMFQNAGVNEVLTPAYSLMSNSSHPSNVSVFQFAQMFEGKENVSSAKILLKISEKIICFFISDFCLLISAAKQEYQKLPRLNKVIIESTNNFMRDKDFVLSNTLDTFSSEIDEYIIKK